MLWFGGRFLAKRFILSPNESKQDRGQLLCFASIPSHSSEYTAMGCHSGLMILSDFCSLYIWDKKRDFQQEFHDASWSFKRILL